MDPVEFVEQECGVAAHSKVYDIPRNGNRGDRVLCVLFDDESGGILTYRKVDDATASAAPSPRFVHTLNTFSDLQRKLRSMNVTMRRCADRVEFVVEEREPLESDNAK